jgi:hypothetical protein
MPRVAIYTSIFGGYDLLKPQPQYPDVTYICATDNRCERAAGWHTVFLAATEEHPRIQAKRFKCMPQLLLGKDDFDYSIWIDGSIVLLAPDFVERCLGALKTNPVALIPHPGWNCIYDEAQTSGATSKYKDERVEEQARHYRLLGFPPKRGLAAGGVVVRKNGDALTEKLGETWFLENQLWSYQDQISLPYVLWKQNTWFDPLPFDLWARKDFTFADHAHNE